MSFSENNPFLELSWKEIETTHPSLALIGRTVRAGVNVADDILSQLAEGLGQAAKGLRQGVSGLGQTADGLGKCGLSAIANRVLAGRMKRPEKSKELKRDAIILMSVAAFSTLGAGIVFAGFATGYSALTLSLLSSTGFACCGAEHLTELRAQTGGAIDVLLWVGGAYLIGACWFSYQTALKDLAEAGKRGFTLKAALKGLLEREKFWMSLRRLWVSVRPIWCSYSGISRFWNLIIRPHAMRAWHSVFPSLSPT